ncbi:MAG: DUF1501 domain-containing protein [Planctomycetota bacterium]
MLSVGGFASRTCQGISRRAFVQASASLPLAFGALGAPGGAFGSSAAKAKSILLVWLWGGPSHLDMFDPKPNAPVEFRGPFAPIATRTPGVHFTELFPKISARSDRLTVVRGHVNFSGDHLEAGSIGLTGAAGALVDYPPNFGSILARHRRSEGLPGFVSLARGAIGDGRGPMKGAGGGQLGGGYDPFLVHCTEEGNVEIPALKLLDGLDISRLGDRQHLLSELDHLERGLNARPLDQWNHLFDQAYSLVAGGDARKAFDLAAESPKTRNAYGHNGFGQSCLLGRRLVEAGVPYVQVNWSQYVEVLFGFADYGWDTHADNFELLMDWHGPVLDRAFAALLDDMESRGLLDSTLVVALGEFGRTPRINEIGSRDHWHQCYCSLWAGAGVPQGQLLGESDARGEHPVTTPITPSMVGTTMLTLAGMTSEDRAQLRVLPEGRTIDGLV